MIRNRGNHNQSPTLETKWRKTIKHNTKRTEVSPGNGQYIVLGILNLFKWVPNKDFVAEAAMLKCIGDTKQLRAREKTFVYKLRSASGITARLFTVVFS